MLAEKRGQFVHDQVIILACFVCLLAKQHTTFKQKDVISAFPLLQGTAETLHAIRQGGKL